MNKQDFEQLISFPEDFPVSRFPWLETKKEKKTTVTYGRKCCELSETLRHVGLSVRMYLESCVLPLPTLYRVWSVKAITSSCLLLKLHLSERCTDGNASRLWRTPTANDAKNSTFPPASLKRDSLAGQIGRKLYPTMANSDAIGSFGGKMHTSLRSVVDGQLNPEWVEWLMGFPIGWTDLKH